MTGIKRLSALLLTLTLSLGLCGTALADVRDPLPADYPPAGDYYGHQLGEISRYIYDTIAASVDSVLAQPQFGHATVYVPIATNIPVRGVRGWNSLIETYNNDWRVSAYLDAIPDAVSAFRFDHPEIFWVESSRSLPNSTYIMRDSTPLNSPGGSVMGYREAGDGSYSYGVSISYDISDGWTGPNARSIAGDRAAAVGWVSRDPQLSAAVNAAPDAAERLRAVHDWLTRSNTYNQAAAAGRDRSGLAWSPISAIEPGLSPVCEGYAKAFLLACRELGIPCVLVSGRAYGPDGSSEAHMWNAVQLEGVWYGVDVTWDDPVLYGGNGLDSGAESDQFFLVGSDVLYPPAIDPVYGRHVPDYVYVTSYDTASYPMAEVQRNSDFLYPSLQPVSYYAAPPQVVAPPATEGETVPVYEVPPAEDSPFYDVPADHWALDAIRFVTEKGVFGGTGGGLFSPEEPMSRAMLAQVLYNISADAVPGVTGAGFSDVHDSDWFSDAVSWCAKKDLMRGYEDGSFGPDLPVTREQLATILWRFARVSGFNLVNFGDLYLFPDGGAVQPWAMAAMSWAIGEGLIGGTDLGLEPQSPATRAQVAAIITRYLRTLYFM